MGARNGKSPERGRGEGKESRDNEAGEEKGETGQG